MAEYRTSIRHSADSVRAFTSAQFKLFQRKKRGLLIAAAALLLVLGALGLMGRLLSALFLLGGCLLFVDLRFIPRRSADAILRQGGVPGPMQYRFDESGIEVWAANGHTRTGYDKLVRLSFDRDYFFLFLSETRAYTFEKKSLEPADPAGFKALVSAGSGLPWKHTDALLSANLYALLQGLRRK